MNLDWHAMFVPGRSLWEVVIRGSVLYLALFFMMRFIVRRYVGGFAIPDLLVVVVIADAAQNAMAGEYRSITEGLVLCATIILWSLALDWLAYVSPPLRHVLEAPPLTIVENGHLNRRNMRKELITQDELMSHLREQGIDNLAEVKCARVESDGAISVLRRDGGPSKKPRRTVT